MPEQTISNYTLITPKLTRKAKGYFYISEQITLLSSADLKTKQVLTKYGITKNIDRRLDRRHGRYTFDYYWYTEVYNPKELKNLIKDHYDNDYRGDEWMLETPESIKKVVENYIHNTYCPLRDNLDCTDENGHLIINNTIKPFELQ